MKLHLDLHAILHFAAEYSFQLTVRAEQSVVSLKYNSPSQKMSQHLSTCTELRGTTDHLLPVNNYSALDSQLVIFEKPRTWQMHASTLPSKEPCSCITLSRIKIDTRTKAQTKRLSPSGQNCNIQ